MLKSQKFLAAGAGFAALAGVIGSGYISSLAAPADSTTPAAVQQVGTQTTSPADDRAAQRADYLQKLAANLGIDPATLTAAMQKTSSAQVDQMVADGKLTQAQADAIKGRIAAGDVGFGFDGGPDGPGGGRHGGPGVGMGMDSAALAQFLGIDEATLKTDLQGGKTLAAEAADHGKTRDELKAFLTDQITANLADAVSSGKLTQAQADAEKTEHLANLDQQIDSVRPAGGPRDGMRGGPPPASGATTPTTG